MRNGLSRPTAPRHVARPLAGFFFLCFYERAIVCAPHTRNLFAAKRKICHGYARSRRGFVWLRQISHSDDQISCEARRSEKIVIGAAEPRFAGLASRRRRRRNAYELSLKYSTSKNLGQLNNNVKFLFSIDKIFIQ